MRPFVSSSDAKNLDRETMSHLKISSFELMQKVSKEIAQKFETDSRLKKGRVLVLCGPGNNGGDGYCLAEYLRLAGRNIRVLSAHPTLSEDCKRAKKFYRGDFVEEVSDAEILVEAIFGASGRSDLSKSDIQILKKANRKNAFRVAIDIPSGIDSISSRAHPESFRADLSFVIAWAKMSMLAEEVAEYLGEVQFLGDDFANPKSASVWALEPSDFSLPVRKRSGFKNLYGRCGIVGGSSTMPGAAVLAAEAAHRVGSGYASIYFAKAGRLQIQIKDANFILKTKWKFSDLQKESALVLGCGGFVKNFKWSDLTRPTVIDAEALGDFKKFKKIKGHSILTPHLGEAAKILKTQTSVVKAYRLESLRELVKATGQSVYLKGAPGLLQFSNADRTYVNLSANPIFSKGGSGDILSGIMGGILAQFFSVSSPLKGAKDFETFERAVISALVFQNQIGEILRDFEGSIASDQLEVFSEAFRRLRAYAQN